MAFPKGVTWRGKYYTLPQAASFVDSSELAPVQLGNPNRLAILGEFEGLIEPKKVFKAGNSALAMQLIHPDSEEARLAARLAFNPAKGVPGASEIVLIAVNPATAATKTFSDVLTLTSYIYGRPANQIKAKIEAGTTTGKKVTVQFEKEIETFDNLAKKSFTIQYTGTGTPATMTINVAAATHTLTTECTGAVADNLALDLNTFKTIQALVDAINATGKYTATIDASNPKDASIELDNVTAQDILSAPYTAKSDLQAIIDGINKTSGYVKATRVVDAAATPANVGFTYLTGGTVGATTNNDWQAAFDLLKTNSIQLIVPLTSDASIHAMGDAHVAYMSGPNGKSERRQFVGGALQSWASEANRVAAVTALLNAAKALGSDRTIHVGLGSYQYNEDGISTLYAGYLTACMYAGIAAGSSVVEPLTNKYLNCLALEVDLRDNEITDLIDGGVAVPIPDIDNGAGYIISRQVTTWGQDGDLYRIEFSVGRGGDYIASEVRKRHTTFKGKPGTLGLDTTIINATNAVLQSAYDNGLIRSYDPKATQLRVDGTIRYVDYSAKPVLPINFIFSTYHMLPDTLTIQL